MWKLFLHIISAILGLWLAEKWIKGVEFFGPFFVFPQRLEDFSQFFSSLVFVGIFLGFLNFFIKPILKTITFPLRVITFNLFTLVIAMVLVWFTEMLFPELEIKGIVPLFWTTFLIWLIHLILKTFTKEPKFSR
jgi:uncharacterized membrane protein YvlD (DUF360 family)